MTLFQQVLFWVGFGIAPIVLFGVSVREVWAARGAVRSELAAVQARARADADSKKRATDVATVSAAGTPPHTSVRRHGFSRDMQSGHSVSYFRMGNLSAGERRTNMWLRPSIDFFLLQRPGELNAEIVLPDRLLGLSKPFPTDSLDPHPYRADFVTVSGVSLRGSIARYEIKWEKSRSAEYLKENRIGEDLLGYLAAFEAEGVDAK